jgi:hypothetical protein
LTTLRLFYPVAVYEEQVASTDLPRSTFVLPTLDRTLRPEWMAHTARDRRGVKPVMIEAGHCPHVSVPGRVADIIVASA